MSDMYKVYTVSAAGPGVTWAFATAASADRQARVEQRRDPLAVVLVFRAATGALHRAYLPDSARVTRAWRTADQLVN